MEREEDLRMKEIQKEYIEDTKIRHSQNKQKLEENLMILRELNNRFETDLNM
jgi:hypothetical protein